MLHKYFTEEIYSRIQRIQFSIDSFINIFFLTTFIILSDTKNLKQKKIRYSLFEFLKHA